MVKTLGMLVMVTRNFAGIRLRFEDPCLDGSEDFLPIALSFVICLGEGKRENRLYLTSCFTWNLIPCDVFETISEHLGVVPA